MPRLHLAVVYIVHAVDCAHLTATTTALDLTDIPHRKSQNIARHRQLTEAAWQRKFEELSHQHDALETR